MESFGNSHASYRKALRNSSGRTFGKYSLPQSASLVNNSVLGSLPKTASFSCRPPTPGRITIPMAYGQNPLGSPSRGSGPAHSQVRFWLLKAAFSNLETLPIRLLLLVSL